MYENLLKKMLKSDRRRHSYCVSEQAVKLAKIYGIDQEKAKIAGLLHDITKRWSPDQHINFIEKNNIKLDYIQKSSFKLLHAISGSIYISECLNIKDPDIINAIRYHTTARANMSMLEKIIYLADFTSRDRKFLDAPYMRELVERSLNDALRFGITYTIRELMDTLSLIHTDTFLAYNYYIKNSEKIYGQQKDII